jgi:hypothetical protein
VPENGVWAALEKLKLYDLELSTWAATAKELGRHRLETDSSVGGEYVARTPISDAIGGGWRITLPTQ